MKNHIREIKESDIRGMRIFKVENVQSVLVSLLM